MANRNSALRPHPANTPYNEWPPPAPNLWPYVISQCFLPPKHIAFHNSAADCLCPTAYHQQALKNAIAANKAACNTERSIRVKALLHILLSQIPTTDINKKTRLKGSLRQASVRQSQAWLSTGTVHHMLYCGSTFCRLGLGSSSAHRSTTTWGCAASSLRSHAIVRLLASSLRWSFARAASFSRCMA